MKALTARFGCVTFVLAALPLDGCVGSARPLEMAPSTFTVLTRHDRSVQLVTSGLEDADPRFSPQIPGDALLNALTRSIKTSGVFKSVVRSNANLELQVVILNLDLDDRAERAQVDVNWKLTDLATDKSLLLTDIRTAHSVDVWTVFNGFKRMRAIAEGAMRENIKEGIRQLSRLALSGPSTISTETSGLKQDDATTRLPSSSLN
jgi:hypothetical protein